MTLSREDLVRQSHEVRIQKLMPNAKKGSDFARHEIAKCYRRIGNNHEALRWYRLIATVNRVACLELATWKYGEMDKEERDFWVNYFNNWGQQ